MTTNQQPNRQWAPEEIKALTDVPPKLSGCVCTFTFDEANGTRLFLSCAWHTEQQRGHEIALAAERHKITTLRDWLLAQLAQGRFSGKHTLVKAAIAKLDALNGKA